MQVVRLAMGLGTVPLRASRNPVLGVFRHHCGSIATVHAPKGRRAHLRYILCDKCGCDQASGGEYQEKIKKNMFVSIEDLEQSEQQAPIAKVKSSDSSKLLTEKLTETLTEKPLTQTEPEIKPKLAEKLTEKPSVKASPPKAQQKPLNPKSIGLAALIGAVFGGLLALAR